MCRCEFDCLGVKRSPAGQGTFQTTLPQPAVRLGGPEAPGPLPGNGGEVSNDAQAELTRANDILEAHPEQRLSRSAARAGTAADRFQVSLSPALGLARGLGAGPAKGGAEASRGGPLAPGENRIGASGRVLTPGLM